MTYINKEIEEKINKLDFFIKIL